MRRLTLIFLALLLAGCAEVPTDPDARAEFEQINDPLEPMNRKIFAANNFLDDHLMAPIARGYRDTLPTGAQTGIHNALINLREPYVAGNELLQGNPRPCADQLGRFIINSTFGVLGIWDVVADSGGAKALDTDIGLTLGSWGIDEGPYLVLPFFGPSNPRDTAGLVAEFWGDPVDGVFAIYGNWPAEVRFAFGTVDRRVRLLDPLDEIKRSSLDLYGTIRSLYRQQRRGALGLNSPQTSEMPP